ncbi:F0F1 ATP synthase subunit epsilon [Desulfosporosinus meridiei]|uniref:ATP synthase epsilon chain n=1 Tax=Desulfosporosinus meridiei (strain ATCC BAA-275 / DSM 13257 / KCTC 12902 / NCIMB 13706 / S10) TaxID=768704 RepID=J7J201_DESMD|nr:F0F1 ATP synthase subunit epsilon [Desulfosporosinus meridiei]AFQ46359.1 ATP synthase, F1 epsilon subunit [Desulfosporosinus meridiei DSM 13257]
MAGTFSLRIVSPEGDLLKENVEFVVFPGAMGELGILPNHAPLIAGLDIGVIRYTLNGTVKHAAIAGGFVEVVDNSAIVLADTAELGGQIDVKRAMEAKERALKRLSARTNEIDVRRAELALRRAAARISAYGDKK